MTSHPFSKVFVIGGTGAQGLVVVRSLVQDGAYSVRILTRDPDSARSQSLKALGPNIELFGGSFTNEDDLRRGYSGCDAAFVNIDGFNTGEKSELFWAIRSYELAVEDGGIKFFVYGNLPYAYKAAGYKKDFRAGHYDGKGRIGEWILWQAGEARKKNGSAMGAALFTSGPYMEMVISRNTPMAPTIEKNEQGQDALTWRVPLGPDGTVPHVSLDDCGPYVRWLFDHPSRSNSMDLRVAIDYICYTDMARAFTAVTSKPARFIDASLETYFKEGSLSAHSQHSAAYSADLKDPSVMSIEENFSGAWHIWRNAKEIVPINYDLLDEILPTRIRSVEEWFQRENEKEPLWDRVQPGKLGTLLKLHEDGFKSPVAHR